MTEDHKDFFLPSFLLPTRKAEAQWNPYHFSTPLPLSAGKNWVNNTLLKAANRKTSVRLRFPSSLGKDRSSSLFRSLEGSLEPTFWFMLLLCFFFLLIAEFLPSVLQWNSSPSMLGSSKKMKENESSHLAPATYVGTGFLDFDNPCSGPLVSQNQTWCRKVFDHEQSHWTKVFFVLFFSERGGTQGLVYTRCLSILFLNYIHSPWFMRQGFPIWPRLASI